MESMWLKCKMLPGMFSNEVLAVIEDPARGEIVSILVDESVVEIREPLTRDRAVDGLLRVQASGHGGRVNVMLPVESAELGRVVSVPLELLAASSAR